MVEHTFIVPVSIFSDVTITVNATDETKAMRLAEETIQNDKDFKSIHNMHATAFWPENKIKTTESTFKFRIPVAIYGEFIVNVKANKERKAQYLAEEYVKQTYPVYQKIKNHQLLAGEPEITED